MSQRLPLIDTSSLDEPVAWRLGAPISRRRFVADASTLAERLPIVGPMLNL